MATLTPKLILADIAKAFAVTAPMLSRVSSDFTSEPLRLNQSAIAHIAKRPDVLDYDYDKGYADNAVESNSLVEDRPLVINRHKHVPIKVSYLQSLQDQKKVYQSAINESACALGKAVVDDGLAQITAANFSQFTAEDLANMDRDILGSVRKSMNKRGAMTSMRTAIVNSDVFEELDADPRIASRDYYGQQTGGEALGMLTGVAGFGQIMEYPDLPNQENLVGFAFDSRAIAVKTGLPADIEMVRNDLGAPSIARFETITDPDTGLTLLGIFWQVPGTFKMQMSVTLMWGWSVGKIGGAEGAVADYAGHRIVTP